MVPSSSTSKEQYKASLKVIRSLHHAFSYVTRDPDAARLIARPMLQLEHEHRQRYGKMGKHHHCKDCAKYYSHGCDRDEYPRCFVPRSVRNGNVVAQMRTTVSTPPADLLNALEWEADRHFGSRQRDITVEILHFVWLGSDSCCGVYGDGPNAWYDWFIWMPAIPAKLQTSNAGYGCAGTALRDVLNAVHDRGLL